MTRFFWGGSWDVLRAVEGLRGLLQRHILWA